MSYQSPRQQARLRLQLDLIVRELGADAENMTALDVGTETGLSGGMLHTNWPHAQIDGVEADLKTAHACYLQRGYAYRAIYHAEAIPFLRDTGEQWDVVLAAEVVEHHEREEGLELLRLVKARARRLAIVTSPVGFLRQGPLEGNPYQVHRSGWTPEELEALGWTVYAIMPERPSLFVAYARGAAAAEGDYARSGALS